MISKEKVLSDALIVLNKDENPWKVTVEGDSIIGTWKWEDTRFFDLSGIDDSTKEFTFTVTLDDKGKWHEKDSSSSKNMSFGSGGISFGASTFSGTSTEKTITFGFGQNKETGEVGIQKNSFDTNKIKEPIRNYLKECGYKKAGFFS